MDLRLMSAEPSDAERAAVDRLLGAPDSGWDGGDRSAADHHVARGGVRQATGVRHLLLPALQAVQGAIGWVSPGALNYISERLSVPPAEAYAVATFYALLATEERPGRVAHVCEDVSCRTRGGRELFEQLSGRDDVVTSPCLGQCDRSPAVLVQRAGEYDASLWYATPETVIDVLEGAEPIDPNPGHYGIPQTEDGSDGLRLLHRVGAIDPYSLDDYRAANGYAALTKALEMTPTELIEEVKRSGIKGRGGAAFPMGVKWEAVVAHGPERLLVCNADEAEPGTFKDRGIMEGDPFSLVEAMTIAGYALGAHRGYLYIRGEYPRAARHVASAIEVAKKAGLLGEDILGSGFDFDIEIRMGGGAYICGEETALFNSIEGFRGEPRQKPPYPAEAGLFGVPTAINNVETLINLPLIVLEGGEAYAARGTPESTGIKLFCLSGDVANPGVYEVEFGATTRELIDLAGGPVGDIAAVLLGGVSGSFIGPDQLDVPLTFEATREAGLALGTAVIMPFSSSTDFNDVLGRIAAFFRDESCGQCVPCRVGTVRQEEALHRLFIGAPTNGEIGLLTEIDDAMKLGSICGLGHTAGSAIQSAIALGLIGPDR
ncbi:MAG: NAD(P)H-dependent oxidoreductase subunit E [Acidimicrobiia bacterium]|nr:NAD(P)H-dependent oxidoreductase subunit E [Acidimicrobiia bacterium]